MMDKKFVFKKIITVFISFILAFGLACLGLCITAKIASNSDFSKSIINKSNYINLALEEIKTDLSDLAIPSGLPSDFFNEKITTDTVSQIVTDSLTHNFKEGNLPDLDFIKEDFKREITSWANENFVFIDESVSSAIDLLAEESYHVILRYCSPEILQFLGQLASTFSKVATVGIICALAFCAFTVFFLFKLLTKKEFYFFSFVSFCSGGLLIGIIPLILLITNKISRIAILSKSLYAFICNFANSALIILVLFGLVLFLISVAFVVFEKRQN